MVCPDCQGDGKQAQSPCMVCRGNGRLQATRNLDIDIPAGIAEGQTLRITGKGEAPARGGKPGDLYVTVHVKPHPQLKREGTTVRAAITVSFVEAALGTSVTVPTLQGEQALTIPAGTQPGTQFTLARLGFPNLQGGSRGDQVVTVQVAVPKKLSRRQRQLLEEFKSADRKGLWRR
jgi:molecular chaperone DnaJ